MNTKTKFPDLDYQFDKANSGNSKPDDHGSIIFGYSMLRSVEEKAGL